MNMEIRHASTADAEKLQQYCAVLFAESLETIYLRDSIPSVTDQSKFIDAIITAPCSVLLLAVVENKVVGMLDAQGFDHPQKCHRIQFGMSVAKEYRRQGIGNQLLKSLIAWSELNNIKRIELEVFTNNPAAILLYENLGFLTEGVKQGAVLVDKKAIDILLMAYTVN